MRLRELRVRQNRARYHCGCFSRSRARTFSRAGSPGGPGDLSRSSTCTPRSPIRLNVRPANSGTASLICAKNIFDRVDAVPHRKAPGLRSRRISQSSRAWPGPRTARLSRCRRPLPLIIDPRFSAKPNDGRTERGKASALVREQVHDDEDRQLAQDIGRNSAPARVLA